MKPDDSVLKIAACLGLLAVALGAFGAHGMQARWDALPDKADAAHRAEVWQKAVHYHLAHAVALVAIGLSAAPRRFKCTVFCWVTGIVLFSGSLYLLGFFGTETMRNSSLVLRRLWIFSTPVGGGFLLIGWLLLLFPRRAAQI